MVGCSHLCRDEIGMCLECAALTGVPGVEFQTRTLRQQTAQQFNLAKGCFRRQNYIGKRGSKEHALCHRQNRQFAAALLEAWAELRALERKAAALKVAAE